MTSNHIALGIAHFTCIDVPPVEFVHVAHDAGYARVGLRLVPAFPSAPYYTVPPGSSDMRALKNALTSTGLSVYDIEFAVVDATFSLENIEAALDAAAELGAKRLSVCGDDAVEERLALNLSKLCERAAQAAIAVDIEIMPWRSVGSLSTALRVASAVQQHNIGLLIDALHLTRSGASPAELKRVAPTLIQHVQLCDAPAVRPPDNAALIAEARGGRLLPGEGRLPLHVLLAQTPRHATLSVEVPNNGAPPREHAKRVFDAAMREIQAQQAISSPGAA
ncbi:sugar phosphate isomerase/epimerase family protein [Terrarubrum flagellatum]|uniref:sugar phosphate isomerase/epimerase family protein n=1 Tax=Terrirubrum flagellatum TaxID=2895980 RepID=UPI003145495A